MKSLIYTLCMLFLFFSCETEKLENDVNSVQGEILTNKRKNKKKGNEDALKIIRQCNVVDLDRCDAPGVISNFWWPNTPTSYSEGLYSSDDDNNLIFTEYDNKTASITGTTSLNNGDCIVSVNVWLKYKRNWDEWQANGGGFKDEPNDCTNADPSSLYYYVIDGEKSIITSSGNDCYEQGTFTVIQRPDPNFIETLGLDFGVIVGPGAGLFDSADPSAEGLSTWGWILDSDGNRKWVMDFNFNFECPSKPLGGCETAFARGNSSDDSTCFINNGFNRWGWTIGAIPEGSYTYEVYAAAGQCDISKGALIGTVDIVYDEDGVSVSHNIDSQYDVDEMHIYAGYTPYPTMKNGKQTVAPGQYYIEDDLSGNIYVIIHFGVCNSDNPDAG